MKVLFWVSPLTELDWPFQKSWWLRNSVPCVAEALAQAGPVDEKVVCVSADLLEGYRRSGGELDGRIVALTQPELTDGYRCNALEARKRFQATGEMSAYYDHLDRLFARRVGVDFVPDVIVSFDDSPFLRRRFPKAVHMAFEYSVFSRAPYPSLYCFDPVSGGGGLRFTYAAHADLINARPAVAGDAEALAELRRAVVSALTANGEVGGYFRGLRSRFDRVLLLPLGYEHFFNTLVQSPYAGQFDLVQHVLESVGPRTCVVLTQHPTVYAIRPERIEELKQLYPNLAFETWYGSVPSFSQVALPYVDGCLTCNSSVAYQAAFLGKHLVLVDGFASGLADRTDLADVEGMWKTPPKNRDNFFSWVLRHAAVEMPRAGDYFRRVLPAFAALRGKPLEECLGLWPDALSGESLSACVGEWIRTCVEPFAEKLKTVKLQAVADDLSGADFGRRRDEGLTRKITELDGQVADLRAQLDGLRNSLSYRLGRLMTWPLRKVRGRR